MHLSLLTVASFALAVMAGSGIPPPQYPPVPVAGTGDWASAVAKAKKFVAKLTLEEKVNMTTGTGWTLGPCVGNTRPVLRLNFPGLCLEDSPLGVRFADYVSAFPAAINAATTWDRDLIHARGVAMGAEHRGKGVNIQLGPMMNMGRVAAGGRNWEGFGSDPYLVGESASQTIQGIQSQGVIATAKHYIGNEQEHFRTTSSSNIDDRTAHEIYLYPFEQSVKAGVGAIMCSYNLVNNTYACENDHTLNGYLKGQLGFQGFVMSDWDATHSGVKSVMAGLDMDMPGDIGFDSNPNTTYFGYNLVDAVNNGSVPVSRLDDMVTRILASWYKLGQDKNYPATNFNAWSTEGNAHLDVQGDHKTVIRQVGSASTVLLKNKKGALPLNKPRTITLIGSDAGPSSGGPNMFADRGGDQGTLAMGWGSGTANFPYLITPLEAIQEQASADHTTFSWYLDDWNLTLATTAAASAEVAIVFSNADSGEDYITIDGNEGDRNNLTLWNNGDNLINAVASVNPNTIVVLHTVGPVLLPWINHPNITAVLWAGLPGQESGNALADVLYGRYNPSGRLPYTLAKKRSDYPADVIYNSSAAVLQIDYTEGLYIDYRWFDHKNIKPQFEFGFGLSYTSFGYSNARARVQGKDSVTVTVTVRNTGKVAGNEVAQLYLGFPASVKEPPKVLRGFEKVFLRPKRSAKVTFELTANELSYWDVPSQRWVVPKGQFTAYVGASSRDIRATLKFNL